MARCAGGGASLGRGVIGEPQGLRNRPQVFCQRGSSGLRGVCPGRPCGTMGCALSLALMLLPPGPLTVFTDPYQKHPGFWPVFSEWQAAPDFLHL